MGVFQHNLGDYDQALDLFTKALKHSEEKDHIYLAMAAGEACRGQVEEALDHLKKSIEIDSGNRIRALRDPDFESLAGNSEYKKLLRPS
jgi:tetratricopeptide (TPR) repeat protein